MKNDGWTERWAERFRGAWVGLSVALLLVVVPARADEAEFKGLLVHLRDEALGAVR